MRDRGNLLGRYEGPLNIPEDSRVSILACVVLLTGLVFAGPRFGETFIVKDGKPNAEIVINNDDRRPRMLALAALALQYYLQKICGARLPIVTQPGDMPAKIYVGRSEHTDELDIMHDGLNYGAFHSVSGELARAAGQDYDFNPPKPWVRSHSDVPRVIEAWDEKVGDRAEAAWGYTLAGPLQVTLESAGLRRVHG